MIAKNYKKIAKHSYLFSEMCSKDHHNYYYYNPVIINMGPDKKNT